MSRDFKDACIEVLADSEADLRELAAVYQALTVAAIHLLHARTTDLDRERQRYADLLTEYRDFRAHIMREAVTV